MLKALAEKVLSKIPLEKEDGLALSSIKGENLIELFFYANKIRSSFRGDLIDLCSITNAKSGACPEDCSYCAQSARAKTDVQTYSLLNKEIVLERARAARDAGARRFCIVTSGKKASSSELKEIADMISEVRRLGLLPCATLGLLTEPELRMIKSAGLERYHHNLETSERFFPEICRSHTYEDKLKTIKAVKSAGLSICSGGIFGLGEDWLDRVDMALALRSLGADSIPLNFLIPVKGTSLEAIEPIPPLEALKIISLYRFLLPDREIRVCGGRLQTLGEFGSLIFTAGADGLLTGNYLTTQGRDSSDDLRLIRQWGLRPA